VTVEEDVEEHVILHKLCWRETRLICRIFTGCSIIVARVRRVRFMPPHQLLLGKRRSSFVPTLVGGNSIWELYPPGIVWVVLDVPFRSRRDASRTNRANVMRFAVVVPR
jgi:hypothetical protein